MKLVIAVFIDVSLILTGRRKSSRAKGGLLR